MGVLSGPLAEPLDAGLLDHLRQGLQEEGLNLVLASCEPNGDSATAVRELLARGVDAVLSLDVSASSELTRLVAAQGKRWLALKRAEDSDAFGRDAGAVLACRYLVSLRHERIVVVTTPAQHRGVQEAMREALSGAAVIVPVIGAGKGQELIDRLKSLWAESLPRGDCPTAIVCSSDLEALAVVRVCHERRYSVPSDVSIVGFGDTEVAKQCWPSLTTVRVLLQDFADRIVEAIKHELAERTPPLPEAPVKLVVRESTGPPSR